MLALAAGPARAAAGDSYEDALAVTEKVAARYDASSSYRIEFTQESYWALADTTAVSKGTLLAEPPSFFAIDYEDGGRVVTAGGSLWVYVPATNQFWSSAIDTVDVALDPAGILRAYRPDREHPFLDAAEGYRTVQLRPTGSIPEPNRITITIDEGRSIVTGITAYATSGDRTTYRMSNTEFDVVVPDGAFEPPRPAETEPPRRETHDSP